MKEKQNEAYEYNKILSHFKKKGNFHICYNVDELGITLSEKKTSHKIRVIWYDFTYDRYLE